MLFSIIIPTYKREVQLLSCVEHLTSLYQQFDSSLYEIIISDDDFNSMDKFLFPTELENIRRIKGPSKGPAANRNNGAKQAIGEWLIFIDDDCLPQANLLNSFFSAIKYRNENEYVFEGKIIADRLQERFDEESPINLKGGCLWSCNFCIKRDTFFDIGMFDESYPYPSMEDADLNERLSKIHPIIFIENAIVVHPWRRVVFFSQFRKRMLSFRFFVNKHYSTTKSDFRISRIKIFLASAFSDFKLLMGFKFGGTLYYLEKIIFNFISIFI